MASNRFNSNIGSFFLAVKFLVEELNGLHAKGIERVYIVGHSLGGAQGVVVKRQTDVRVEIRHVFTIASPIRNTPWWPLKILVYVALGLDPDHLPPELETARQNLRDNGDEFTTFSIRDDFIAPLPRNLIADAENVELSTRFLRHVDNVPPPFLTHAGCLLHPTVHRTIVTKIARLREEKVAAYAV